jgi:hypothetical protein
MKYSLIKTVLLQIYFTNIQWKKYDFVHSDIKIIPPTIRKRMYWNKFIMLRQTLHILYGATSPVLFYELLLQAQPLILSEFSICSLTLSCDTNIFALRYGLQVCHSLFTQINVSYWLKEWIPFFHCHCLAFYTYMFSPYCCPVVIWVVHFTKNIVKFYPCVFVVIRMSTAKQQEMLTLCCQRGFWSNCLKYLTILNCFWNILILLICTV